MTGTHGGSEAEGELLGGRYRLGALLGVGGSAAVHRADDVLGGPPVAIKILHPHLCADAAARRAFLREARHAASVTHGNVVLIHDAGLHEAGGVTMPWIALDLLRGKTLRDWVRTHGPLPPAEAAAVVTGMLAGLEAAHAAGIVHRDISPQNIVLETAGTHARAHDVRILDFGLADASGRSTVGADVLLAERPTAGEGAAIVGNVHFMSPEQASGRPLRAGSDLYQVGAVLFFLLTGVPPFPRSTNEEVLRAHLVAPPPVPSAVVPAARPLDGVVVRALTKTPARRFRDAGEFRAALAEAVTDLPDPFAVQVAARDGGEETRETGPTTLLPRGATADDLDYLSPGSSGERPGPDPAPGSHGAAVAVGLGAVVLAMAVIAGVFVAAFASANGREGTPAPSSVEVLPDPDLTSPPVLAATPGADAPVAPPEASPTQIVTVPELKGDLAAAEAALARMGLARGTVTRMDSSELADRVLAQSPRPGAEARPGDTVDLVIASGRSSMPKTAGLTLVEARAAIEAAGFRPSADPRDAADAERVLGSDPGPGVTLPVGSAVILRLERSAPATPQPTSTDGAGS
ncbi:MAG: protein kinase [Microbacterium sp.]|jgi:serine/threonine-protein kinase|uniref:protein kinase domain-containing protein n=1 Tax=Microbacterium sp. TaxID=51671 RepID=UPI00282C8F59|nr:PASTA domain-containing protein [Microbacterium sp.]MDR2322623.1 protein kinase [Microbacterium sp.]